MMPNTKFWLPTGRYSVLGIKSHDVSTAAAVKPTTTRIRTGVEQQLAEEGELAHGGARVLLPLGVEADPALMRYVVTKGYIAIDGTSLTVVDTGAGWFNVTLIDYTQQKITLPRKKPGDRVNLEVDILAKYVERLTGGPSAVSARTPVTSEFLKEHGFLKEGAR